MLLCREAGYFDLSEIQTAIFEPNGKISILPKSDNRPLAPSDLGIAPKAAHIGTELIMDGRIMGENLVRIGRDERWLQKKLELNGYKNPKEILLGIYRSDENSLTLYQANP